MVDSFPSLAVQHNTFYKRLVGLLESFGSYELEGNRNAALRYVPCDDLRGIAFAKYSSCSNEAEGSKGDLIIRDLFLLELLNWFKEDFFTWMDQPNCPRCSQPTKLLHARGKPTILELQKSATQVEVYTCPACCEGEIEVARFPRYNDPVILLEARVGRCGEWANCFALICRALNFEVRSVSDWTDHVWVEVFSEIQGRWLHVDPCENKCDMPLLYERGWGKELTYVIAVSQDDIQDVTWRYSHSSNHKNVLARRNLVDENWLVNQILELRRSRQRHCSTLRLEILQQRFVREIVEFLCPTVDREKDGELEGRGSGSLAWRLARQEIGSGENRFEKGFVWLISNDTILKFGTVLKYFYDCVKDEYFIDNADAPVRRSWSQGAYEIENISRKEEKDWKMVYLARREQVNSIGILTWRFQIEEPSLKFKAVELQIPYATFHPSASISIDISTSDGEVAKFQGKFADARISGKYDLKSGIKWVDVTCKLDGGNGPIAWQQFQLFRCSTNTITQDKVEHPFITIILDT